MAFSYDELVTPNGSEPGWGFAHIPGGLPAKAVITFRNLAALDQLLSHYRQPDAAETKLGELMNVRNDLLHKLLSLPAWEEIEEALRETSYEATYEVARLTTVLYSNSVLLALPPHNLWFERGVRRLRRVLEVSNLQLWTEDATSLLTWSLLIGGIAAYRTRDRKFFEQRLRETLLTHGGLSWPAVKQRLKEFMWVDSACEYGAAILWDALELDHG